MYKSRRVAWVRVRSREPVDRCYGARTSVFVDAYSNKETDHQHGQECRDDEETDTEDGRREGDALVGLHNDRDLPEQRGR